MTTVQAVTRAFSILDAIAAQPAGAGVSDIARRVDLPKSTVARLLTTLELLGAVQRRPNETAYQIGDAMASLVARAPVTLVDMARPILHSLALLTEEDVALAVPEGDYVRYLYQAPNERVVQVRDWTGACLPLHTVSAGRVFLAYRSTSEVEAYLTQPLEAYTSLTLTQPDALRQRIAAVRQQGFDWTKEEFALELNAVSAPVFAPDGAVVAALNIFGPAYRFPPPGSETAVTQAILAAAATFSARLKR